MKLITFTENLVVNLLLEVFKILTQESDQQVTTTIFVTPATFTPNSKYSDAVLATNFFSKTGNLKRHLVTCNEDVKHIHPKSVYELRETLFEKLDAVNTPYRDEKNG